MKLDFRIDWGYQYLYSRRHYHPVYLWDGQLDCNGGRIEETYQLDYPVIWYGPGHCAHETKLAEPKWKSRTRRGLSGVRFVADADENATFHLTTLSGTFDFSAKFKSYTGYSPSEFRKKANSHYGDFFHTPLNLI